LKKAFRFLWRKKQYLFCGKSGGRGRKRGSLLSDDFLPLFPQ
jgi:hypothetical protein